MKKSQMFLLLKSVFIFDQTAQELCQPFQGILMSLGPSFSCLDSQSISLGLLPHLRLLTC